MRDKLTMTVDVKELAYRVGAGHGDRDLAASVLRGLS